jgi:hypothetical protein
MKFEWARKARKDCCIRNESSGLAWFKVGTLKLRGMRKDLRKGDAVHVERVKMLCIYYSENRKWVEQFLSRK